MRYVGRISVCLLGALLLIGAQSVVTGAKASPKEQASEQAEWTIMVFLNADNNLEPFGIRDFLEMAKVGSSDSINIIVQFDRTPGESDEFEDWTNTLRFRVGKNMTPIPANAVEDIGEADMGSGDTLAQFVQWATTKYPAKRYLLDIWDHGQGWRFRRAVTPSMAGTPDSKFLSSQLLKFKKQQFDLIGKTFDEKALPIPVDRVLPPTYRYVSHDDSSGTKLYNRVIQDSLKAQLQGKKLDVIGFDACLMSMTETAFAMREIAQVMVGSEELEPGAGWNYEKFLSKLAANPAADARAVGEMLVLAYKEHYSGFDEETTLSAVDLTKVETLGTSISMLADLSRSKLSAEHSNILKARRECANYAPGRGLHGIDLARYCQQLALCTTDADLKTAAQAVDLGVKGMVTANFAGADRQGKFGSAGLAIYFPGSKTEFLSDPDRKGYEKTNVIHPVEFVQKHTWPDFLQAYFVITP